jgi:alcohol dehydrogenase (cytochrome c)/quinohemoprotein ethanol dehydrogenase
MGNSNGKQLSAYNAKNGQKLWTFDAQTAVYAAPITYELDGVQYIAASVGGTSGNDYYAPTYARMLVFKVGGNVKLPAPAPYTPPQLNPPPSTAAPEIIARGNQVYDQHCSVCHGAGAVQQRSSFPNLTYTPFLHSQEGFDQVVLKGVKLERGMGNFSDRLNAADSAAVREYIISRANEVKRNPPPAGGRGGAGAGAAAAPTPARAPTPATAPASNDVHQEAAAPR